MVETGSEERGDGNPSHGLLPLLLPNSSQASPAPTKQPYLDPGLIQQTPKEGWLRGVEGGGGAKREGERKEGQDP